MDCILCNFPVSVYKSIIHTCSHPPEIEPLEKDGEFWKKSSQKWEGVKDETITYKNYLPLWKALMMPEKVGSIKVSGKHITCKVLVK